MSNFKHRIVIFVCYYGTFPWYFKYFLHSCKFNPSVDFIIFTDIPCKEELPDNVSVEIKSLNDIRTLVSEKLGYAVNIDTPYKLCDYKPVLGLIFNHYASGYDFWGQCDIDIILGDLRSFMDEGFLNAYDFVSCRDTWATGLFFSVQK
ncbi:DUF6625 family protein [Puia sp. P3]|uniref:DUF6625 family protein n=1 Tax=Puia sp. P3 TaxID=3423952 RepID=UPI003D67D531